MITTKFIQREDQIDSNGECPIYLRITCKRKAVLIHTGIRVLPSQWEGRIKRDNKKLALQQNQKLSRILEKVQSITLEMENQGQMLSAKAIKDKYLNPQKDEIIDFATNVVKKEYEDGKISVGTYQKYMPIIKKFNGFIEKNHGSYQITLQELNLELIEGFETYLKSKHSNRQSTINANLRFLRKLCNEAIRQDKMKSDRNPFIRYKFKTVKTEIEHCTEEEICMIQNHEFEPNSREELVHDILLFGLETGLRIGDILCLTKDRIANKHVLIRQQKGKDFFRLMLTSRAQELVSKYMSQDNLISSEYLFPLVRIPQNHPDKVKLYNEVKNATAKVNGTLKKIAKTVGINKNLRTHIARHSVAVRCLTNKLSKEQVQAMLNHQSMSTTEHYAKFTSEFRDNAVLEYGEISKRNRDKIH